MKTYAIEVQRIKSMSDRHDMIHTRVDATVSPQSARDDGAEPSTTLSLSVDDARVLYLLLKKQFAEIDSRKARSQR